MEGQSKKEMEADFSILEMTICRLHSSKLITDEERQLLTGFGKNQVTEIKAKLYDLFAKREAEVAKNIHEIISSAVKSKEETLIQPDSSYANTHPLMINTIINCIYGFLHLDSIKECRVVCSKWNFVAEPLLRKRARISFRRYKLSPFYNANTYTYNRGVESYAKMILNSSTTAPFIAFVFRGGDWPFSELSKFFSLYKKDVKELTMENISVVNENGETIKSINIDDWIAGAPLIKLHLEHLPGTGELSKFEVSFKNLHSVKSLFLDNCIVDVAGEEGSPRVTPTEICLRNVLFQRKDGEKISNFRLNDSIDLGKAQNVELSFFHFNIPAPILDLNEYFDVYSLTIRNVRLLNCSTSKSIVESLNLEDVLFMDKTEMKIKRLDFECNETRIDLSALPSDLESLHLGHVGSSRVISSEPVFLPILKELILGNATDFRFLNNFFNCPQLTEIDICYLGAGEDFGEGPLQLNLDLLPSSLKNLRMAGSEKVIGELTLELDNLILKNCSFSNAIEILTKINPRTLGFNWNQIEGRPNSDGVLQIIKGRDNPTFVGPFLWYESQFESSELSSFVDKHAIYYHFENQKGKSIEYDEFSSKLYDSIV